MSRTQLLGAASAAALACFATGAFAQSANTITGGGSTLAEFDYFVEFATFNGGQGGTSATFANPSPATGNNILYWPAGSGSGQAAFLNDDISCDANKVLKTNGANGMAGTCSNTVGGAAAVSYGASDSTLTSAQIAQWASSSVGQAVAGNLIQLPSMGVGVAIPVVNAKVTKNGATTANVAIAGGLTLTDSDLCGIFSGKITDWSGVTNYAKDKIAAGPIEVAYRSDGSGTSFLLLNHLSFACTSSNSNFPLPLNVSTTFANAFTGGTVPSNFIGESGSSAVANYLSNTGPSGTPAATSAIGYLSPDFTTVDPMSNAFIGQNSPPNQKSALVVAAVAIGTKPFIPTVANVAAALNHPVAADSSHTTPPTTAATAADPTSFVPLVGEPTTGYPIVGYTTFDFAQCYQNANVATAIINFMTDHFTNSSYTATEANNGFVTISTSGAKAFANAINRDILANTSKYNDNIQNTTVCKSPRTGR